MKKDLLLALAFVALLSAAGCDPAPKETQTPAPEPPVVVKKEPDSPTTPPNTPPSAEPTPSTPDKQPSTPTPEAPKTNAAETKGGSLVLRLKPSSKRYSFANEIQQIQQSPMGNSNLTQKFTQTVDVKKQSPASISFAFAVKNVDIILPSDSPMLPQEKAMEKSLAATKFESQCTPQGKMLPGNVTASDKGSQTLGAGMAETGLGFLGVEYPKEGVKVGSTWESQLDISKMINKIPSARMKPGSSGKMSVRYRVTKIETVGKRQMVTIDVALRGVVEVEMAAKEGTQGMSMELVSSGTTVVDAADGFPMSQNAKATISTRVGTMTASQTSISVLKRM